MTSTHRSVTDRRRPRAQQGDFGWPPSSSTRRPHDRADRFAEPASMSRSRARDRRLAGRAGEERAALAAALAIAEAKGHMVAAQRIRGRLDTSAAATARRPGPRERRRRSFAVLVEEREALRTRVKPAAALRTGIHEAAQPAMAAVGLRLVVEAADRGEDAAVAEVPLLDLVVVALDVRAEAAQVLVQARLDGLEPGVLRVAAGVDAAEREQVVLDLVEGQRVDVALGLGPVGRLARLERDELDSWPAAWACASAATARPIVLGSACSSSCSGRSVGSSASL